MTGFWDACKSCKYNYIHRAFSLILVTTCIHHFFAVKSYNYFYYVGTLSAPNQLPYSRKCLRGIKFCGGNFDGIPLKFLPPIFNYLTFARVHAHVSSSQSFSQSYLSYTISLQVRDCLLLGLHVSSLMLESLHESNKRVASLCEETSLVPKRSKTPATVRMIVLA